MFNMKKLFLSLLILIYPFFVYNQIFITPEPQSMTKRIDIFVGQGYDIKYHKLYISVTPGSDHISGGVFTKFIPLDDTDTMDFDANQCLVIDSVIYHGNAMTFIHQNNRLIIKNLTLVSQSLDSIIIYYHGTPAASGFGSFYSDSQWLWTLSEPFGASDWWPCKNDLSDKIDSIDIFIEHPSNYIAVANGLEQSKVDLVNSRTLTHWKHKYPVATYLIAIAVAPYHYFNVHIPLTEGDLQIDNYVLSSAYNNAQNAMPNFSKVMKFYDSLIAPYPFMNERYGHAHFGWGGGMEHQTISFVGSFDYELLAHQLLHQWYGDAVTCGSWHDVWLNEGFATYFTALSQEKFFPQDFIYWKNQSIDFITYLPCGAVYVYDTTSVDRIFNSRLSYRKGAYILHMLRWILGDDVFFNGVRQYYQTYKYNSAKTEDFKNIMEQVSDTTLTEFFNDWIYDEGYPMYNFTVTNIDDDNFKIQVHQSSSCHYNTFFEMPLPFLLRYDIFDTIIILNNLVQNQDFFINLPMPNEIIFDPNKWILTKNATIIIDVETYLNKQLSIYPNPASNKVAINNHSNNKFTLVITDLLSKKLIVDDCILPNSTYTVDISSLITGTYLMTFKSEKNEIITKKLVKQ